MPDAARITEHIQRADERLMTWSGGIRSAGRDRALITLTEAASLSRLWFVIAGGLAVVGGRRGRRAACRGVAAIAVASAVSNGPAKWAVRRRRPSASPPLIPLPPSTSFPSGHAASGFAFAFAVGTEIPAMMLVLVPLAAAVAYSRVHVGVHYPSDVTAGIVIGLISGGIASRVGRGDTRSSDEA
jgi:undecaprenyl-diphosphatase